jgi:phosphinothricin acetyltransferase
MTLVQCDYRRHAQPILAIFNEAIVHSTALYDYKPRTTEKMVTWFENKRKGKFPVIGVENEAGELMGFASYGIFRAWPAYKYTVEHSVYVDGRFRGRGIGKRLLQEIVAAAQGQNYHVLVGCIDAANSTSIRLHEAAGFTYCGTIRCAPLVHEVRLAVGSVVHIPIRLLRRMVAAIRCPQALGWAGRRASWSCRTRRTCRP